MVIYPVYLMPLLNISLTHSGIPQALTVLLKCQGALTKEKPTNE